jgi:hypothetical protein
MWWEQTIIDVTQKGVTPKEPVSRIIAEAV